MMFFPYDTHFVEPIAAANPGLAEEHDRDIFLRRLIDILRNDPGWLEVTPSISAELRHALITTCYTRIEEHEEVIDMIRQGFEAGYHTIPPEKAAAVHTDTVASLRALIVTLQSIEQDE